VDKRRLPESAPFNNPGGPQAKTHLRPPSVSPQVSPSFVSHNSSQCATAPKIRHRRIQW